MTYIAPKSIEESGRVLRDYVTFGTLLSQIRLSSVTLVRVLRALKISAIGPITSPFCTLAILSHPCKVSRRSSQGNPSFGSVERKRGSKRERWWTYRRLYLIYMSRSGRPTSSSDCV